MPLPPRPERSCSTSPKLRACHKAWREACKLFILVNGLNDGGTEQNHQKTSQRTQARSAVDDRMKVGSSATAARLASARLVSRAAELVRARRSLFSDLTGVHTRRRWGCTSALLGASSDDSGYLRLPTCKQVTLCATKVVEPDPYIQQINMLHKLPYDESIFYSQEENVITRAGKSQVMANSIEEKYCFIGGTENEYIKYLALDRAKPLWKWSLASRVKAYTGFATILKKTESLSVSY